MLRETFRDAKEFGSILSIPKPLADALNELGENPFARGSHARRGHGKTCEARRAGEHHGAKYDVVVTNPPYGFQRHGRKAGGVCEEAVSRQQERFVCGVYGAGTRMSK